MDVVSLFAGAGGLDLGFKQAGFNVPWANEYDKAIWQTYRENHPDAILCTKSISDIDPSEIPPNPDGLIGGPPCQSWSLAGSMRGIQDKRGKLFYEYLRILKALSPKFFLAENVPGLVTAHKEEFEKIKTLFSECGYNVYEKILDANDYGVPQERKRLIVVGYRKDLGMAFEFVPPDQRKLCLRDAIGDLPEPVPTKGRAKPLLTIPNHEYLDSGYSSMYLSRNRVRKWNEPSFTILAMGRHAPQHPSCARMKKVRQDVCVFDRRSLKSYRRLSVRECARIQTFPDDFIFYYDRVESGYKMVGNAVPVELARRLAMKIKADLEFCGSANREQGTIIIPDCPWTL